MELVKEDEFFKEFTVRIFSSLDTKQSIKDTFEYLKRYFPLDVLAFSFYDYHIEASRLAHYSAEIDVPNAINSVVPLPRELWDEQLRILKQNGNKAYIMCELYNKNIYDKVDAYLHIKEYSILALPICYNENVIGGMNLIAKGSRMKYNDAHAKLLNTIIEPATIALINSQTYQKVLNHRDELIDNNQFLYSELLNNSASKIIGASSGLKRVMHMIEKVAPQSAPVLILGETGTGKELIANAIHFSSNVKNGPFIKVNCGAIPENLIDSELFGHVKGAFTGATSDKKGRFERADGGTIFLDEIGELPLQAQVRLLRVLQHHEIEQVGGNQSIKIDIRVIAATNRNLVEMVSKSQFREDLWYRLNVFPIIIPPLRQRKEDIPDLASFFVEKKSIELNMKPSPQIAPGELERLMQYDWYGNIRELENLVERELIMHQGVALRFHSLPSNKTTEKVISNQNAVGSNNFLTLDEVMAAHISKTLNITKGKMHGPSGAAELLGIKATTLEARMKKLGMKFGRKINPAPAV